MLRLISIASSINRKFAKTDLIHTVSLILLFVGLPLRCHAYIDPGTGSVILQGTLATIAVALGAAKLYWYRIKEFLGMNSKREAAIDNTNQVPSEDSTDSSSNK